MTIASLDLLRAILRKTAAQSALLMAIGVYVGVWNVRVFADEKDDFFESKIRPILATPEGTQHLFGWVVAI